MPGTEAPRNRGRRSASISSIFSLFSIFGRNFLPVGAVAHRERDLDDRNRLADTETMIPSISAGVNLYLRLM